MNEKERITIRCEQGRTPTVEVFKRIGVLAMHVDWMNPTAWAITHVPTGHKACMVKKQEDAIKIIERLARLDWNFRSPRSPKVAALKAGVRKVVKAITGKDGLYQS